jgi:hypothetical protein
MHGMGVDDEVPRWFDTRMPRSKVKATAVRTALDAAEGVETDPASRLVWIGERVQVESVGTKGRAALALQGRLASTRVPIRESLAGWLEAWVGAASLRGRGGRPYPTLGEMAATYPGPGSFAAWSQGRAWRAVRRAGLLIV